MRQCAIKTIVTGDEVQSHRTVHASLYPRPALVLTYFERGIVENKNTSVYALFQHESLEDLCLTQFLLSPVNSSSCSSGCDGFEALCAGESCEELGLGSPGSLAASAAYPAAPNFLFHLLLEGDV